MISMRDQRQTPASKISSLAKAWCQLIYSECPPDWHELMPQIDFFRPDRMPEPRSLPVLDYLPRLVISAPEPYRSVLAQLIDARAGLYFGQTYSESDFGTEFLNQYGWIKLLGPDGYWHSDQISSGFLILGDNIIYPQHWHEAEELYLPISGDAKWYHQNQGWQLQPAGSLIHHASRIKHATRTIGEPMIALYLWRGGNLTQKSIIQ